MQSIEPRIRPLTTAPEHGSGVYLIATRPTRWRTRVKVGRSTDIVTRRNAVQTDNADVVEYVAVMYCKPHMAPTLESTVMEQLQYDDGKHCNGEWFEGRAETLLSLACRGLAGDGQDLPVDVAVGSSWTRSTTMAIAGGPLPWEEAARTGCTPGGPVASSADGR